MSPRNSKPYWNCTTWRFIKRYRCPISEVGNCGVERSIDQKLRYESLMPDMRKLDLEPWERVARELLALKEEKVPVTSGKKEASVRKETNAVSGMRVMIVHKNQTTMPPHLLSQPFHKVEMCREREAFEANVTMDPFCDNRADIS